MKFILCSTLLITSVLVFNGCLFKSRNGSTEQSAVCEKLSSVDACVHDETIKGSCAYNHTTGSCIGKPKTLTWPNQTIASGTDYVCAVTVDGNVNCWGYNYGRRILSEHPHPDQDAFTTINAVSHLGFEEIMATTESGKVFFAGNKRGADRGVVDTLTEHPAFSKNPYSFAFTGYGLEPECALTTENNSLDCLKGDMKGRFIRSVSAGFEHYCVIDENLAIQCSGKSAKAGTDFNRAIPKGQFERIAIARDLSNIHTAKNGCAIKWPDGKIVCFTNSANAVTANVPDIAARQVVAEHTFAVALDGEGALHFWGDETIAVVKSLGDEIRTARLTKVRTIAAFQDMGAPVTAVAVCAVKEDGSPVCFGSAPLKASLNSLAPFKVKTVDDIQFPLMTE